MRSQAAERRSTRKGKKSQSVEGCVGRSRHAPGHTPTRIRASRLKQRLTRCPFSRKLEEDRGGRGRSGEESHRWAKCQLVWRDCFLGQKKKETRAGRCAPTATLKRPSCPRVGALAAAGVRGKEWRDERMRRRCNRPGFDDFGTVSATWCGASVRLAVSLVARCATWRSKFRFCQSRRRRQAQQGRGVGRQALKARWCQVAACMMRCSPAAQIPHARYARWSPTGLW